MADETYSGLFLGLDPAPIRIELTEDRSHDAIYAAAGLPPSPFIQMVQPYQLHQPDTETFELSLGPQGFGAELLNALRWLAQVAAVGILHTLPGEEVTAYVQHYLEVDKPEWGYEELTEHGAAFIRDRYQRATTDPDYQRGLDTVRQDPVLVTLGIQLQQWRSARNAD